MQQGEEGEFKKRISAKIQWQIVSVPLVDVTTNQPTGSAPMNLPMISTFALDKIFEDAKKEFPKIRGTFNYRGERIRFIAPDEVEKWFRKWFGSE